MPSRAQKRKRSQARKHGTEAAKMRDGGAALLPDLDHPKADIAMINVAVARRCPITQTILKRVVRRLANVVDKKTVKIATKDGVFDCEATADKNATAAGNTLIKMAAMNQRDELESIRRSGQQKPTQTIINNGVLQVDNRTDERRNQLIALGERFRTGTVLVSDSSGSDR